jgi:nucleoside-diphosphate-sugar epimerase
MNLLITGVTSNIGKHLIKYLDKTDYKIYCTIRNLSNKLFEKKDNIEFIEIDLLNQAEYTKLPDNIDFIVHLAAANKFSGLTELEIIAYNILLNTNIITYAANANAKKIIYSSSISVYGQVRDKIVTNNTMIDRPDCYGVSKFAGEVGINSLRDKISSISLRLPAILGDKNNTCFITNICNKLSKNEDVELYNPSTLFNNVIKSDAVSNFIYKLIINENWFGHHSFPIASKDPIELNKLVCNLKNRLNSHSLIKCIITEANSYTIDSSYAIINFEYSPEKTIDTCNFHSTFFQN